MDWSSEPHARVAERFYRHYLFRKRITATTTLLVVIVLLWLVVSLCRSAPEPNSPSSRWVPPPWLWIVATIYFTASLFLSERLSRGFACRSAGDQLLAEGKPAAAAICYRRALDELSSRRWNPSVRGIIHSIELKLVEAEMTDSDGVDAPSQIYARAAASGDQTSVASALLLEGRAVGAEQRWPEIEMVLRRFLRDFPSRTKGRTLAPTLAQLGELALAHESHDLARALLAAALEAAPFADECAVLIGSHLGWVELARGDLPAAAARALAALETNGPIDPPFEVSVFPPEKAWQMIGDRTGRPLPFRPSAYLFSVLSALYRRLGAPSLAWQCAVNAFARLWEYYENFPDSCRVLDGLLLEFGLIGFQAGRYAAPLVPSEVLSAALLRNPCSRLPWPEPSLELRALGLCILERHVLRPDQVEEVRRRWREQEIAPADALRALMDLGRGRIPDPRLIPDLTREENPWELSRWALVAQWSGEMAIAAGLHERAARLCGEQGPDRWRLWVELRWARFLHAVGRDAEAAEICARGTTLARSCHWEPEAGACRDLRLLLGQTPEVEPGLPEAPQPGRRLPLDDLRWLARMAQHAYRSGLPQAAPALVPRPI